MPCIRALRQASGSNATSQMIAWRTTARPLPSWPPERIQSPFHSMLALPRRCASAIATRTRGSRRSTCCTARAVSQPPPPAAPPSPARAAPATWLSLNRSELSGAVTLTMLTSGAFTWGGGGGAISAMSLLADCVPAGGPGGSGRGLMLTSVSAGSGLGGGGRSAKWAQTSAAMTPRCAPALTVPASRRLRGSDTRAPAAGGRRLSWRSGGFPGGGVYRMILTPIGHHPPVAGRWQTLNGEIRRPAPHIRARVRGSKAARVDNAWIRGGG